MVTDIRAHHLVKPCLAVSSSPSPLSVPKLRNEVRRGLIDRTEALYLGAGGIATKF